MSRRLPDHGFELDDFQRRAVKALEAGEAVLVAAPTGTGKAGVAAARAATAPGAQKGNDGQRAASPGPTPLAISTISNASVPLAQATTCLAPQNDARSASS